MSFLILNAIGHPFCIRVAPIPTLDASHSTTKSEENSIIASKGKEFITCFQFSKSFCPFFVSSINGSFNYENPFINHRY